MVTAPSHVLNEILPSSWAVQSMHDVMPYEDTRPNLQKVQNIFMAVGGYVRYLATRIAIIIKHEIFGSRPQAYCSLTKENDQEELYADKDLSWNQGERESQGLYVLVHGLRGTPKAWEEYRTQIESQYPRGHVFIPSVYKGGNCPLEEAAKPIIDAVKKYRNLYPAAPIRIIGVSNGARIAGAIARDRDIQQADVKVASIAGVHFGTRLLRLAVQYDFVRKILGLNSQIVEELQYSSEYAQNTLREWRSIRPSHENFFYATTEDEKVLDYTSSLPIVGSKDRYFVAHGCNHDSIVQAVRQHLLSLMTI